MSTSLSGHDHERSEAGSGKLSDKCEFYCEVAVGSQSNLKDEIALLTMFARNDGY